MGVLLHRGGQRRRHAEALARQPLCRGDRGVEVDRAIPLERGRHPRDGAGHADRQVAVEVLVDARLGERVLRERRGRGLAEVEGARAAGATAVDEEPAAADPAALRSRDADREHAGDGGVHRVAAADEHVPRGPRCRGRLARDDALVARLGRAEARSRLCLRRRRPGEAERQQGGDAPLHRASPHGRPLPRVAPALTCAASARASGARRGPGAGGPRR
jgi:hypothetical protein